MKYISWNVNGIRACLKKWFLDYLKQENPDIIGLQETKWRMEQVPEEDITAIKALGYHIYWNAAQRPGYSGTAVFSKKEPINIHYGILEESFDFDSVDYVDETLIKNHEGRVVTLEFEDHYFVTVYTPNSKRDLSRLSYRYDVWDKAFLQYLEYLESNKPVVACGDLNVAHKEIDLARPKDNKQNAGFTQEERERFTDIMEKNFIDTFRYKYPDKQWAYSWWTYMWGARGRNIGWRIDYFLISQSLENNLNDALIHSEALWSDHCPVAIDISL